MRLWHSTMSRSSAWTYERASKKRLGETEV